MFEGRKLGSRSVDKSSSSVMFAVSDVGLSTITVTKYMSREMAGMRASGQLEMCIIGVTSVTTKSIIQYPSEVTINPNCSLKIWTNEEMMVFWLLERVVTSATSMPTSEYIRVLKFHLDKQCSLSM